LKKYFLISILTIFFIFSNYGLSYKNPFWIKSDKVVKIKNFKLNSIILYSNISYDFINGIRNGIFYELNFSFDFSNYFFINSNLRLGENVPLLKVVNIKLDFNPLSVFAFSLSYRLKSFYDERILEHNIIFLTKEIINTSKFYKMEFIQGFNFRFIDLDTIDYGIVYKRDFLFNYFILWGIKILFNPLYFYSVGIDISNFNDTEIFSQNYWQFEIINYFHLPYKISLYLNGGGGFSGSFPFAGILNRLFFTLGVRYEIKI